MSNKGNGTECRYGTINSQVKVPRDVDELEKVKQRFLSLSAFMGVEDFARGWFCGAELDEIKRGNAEAFVAYSMYCRRKEELSPEVWISCATLRAYSPLWNVVLLLGEERGKNLAVGLRIVHVILFSGKEISDEV